MRSEYIATSRLSLNRALSMSKMLHRSKRISETRLNLEDEIDSRREMRFRGEKEKDERIFSNEK